MTVVSVEGTGRPGQQAEDWLVGITSGLWGTGLPWLSGTCPEGLRWGEVAQSLRTMAEVVECGSGLVGWQMGGVPTNLRR